MNRKQEEVRLLADKLPVDEGAAAAAAEGAFAFTSADGAGGGSGGGETDVGDRWLSGAWLDEWANSEGPAPPIDNAALLCPHQRLDVDRTVGAKRISAFAWQRLQVGLALAHRSQLITFACFRPLVELVIGLPCWYAVAEALS